MATTYFPLFNPHFFANGGTTRAITSANTKAACIYIAPKTGNIRFIGTAFSAFSGSGTVDLRLETVSSRLPTGTLYGTNTNVNYTPAATNTWVWSQLTADAAVTAGDLLAAACVYVSGTSATVKYGGGNSLWVNQLIPYSVVATAGTYANANVQPCICLKYDDGTIIRGGIPASNFSSNNFNSGTNPRERATVFTPPFDCTCIGAMQWSGGSAASTAYSLNLYAGTSTTATATATMPTDPNSGTGGGAFNHFFGTPVSLTKDTTYRISLLATTANNLNVAHCTWLSTAERNACCGPMWSDTRNGGSWIGEDTLKSEMLIPLIDSASVNGGAGSLIGSGLIR